MSPPTDTRTRVLIVGAGPAGLSLAIELGHRSIPCLLIERNDRVGYAPRAKTTNVRTREHLRRWGIADQLKAASPLGADYPSNIVFCTRLAGHPIAKFENAMYCAPGKNPLYSEHAQWIPQYTVEEVLRAHAQSLPGVELRFNTELQGFEQDASGVTAAVQDLATKSVQQIRCDYLVGADGARSRVREAIGARMEGKYGLSRNYNVVFRAPGLAEAHGHGPAIMYWQVNGDAPSLIGPMDRGDKWFFMPSQVPEGFKLSDLGAAGDWIRRATGIDLPYEILSSDEWVASQLLADRYRSGRVFLAGDACHLHPPFGGFGMNMGVSDSVDLGWKLAAVLQGWGGEALLDSYERERRPVHQFVLDEAVTNHATLGNQLQRPGIEDAGAEGERIRREVGVRVQAAKMREFYTLGVVLGYRYDGSPVIVGDGSEATPNDFVNYVPSARPGSLAPHAWMHNGSSLYDHFGKGFTLLATDDRDAAAVDDIRAAAAAAGVPLQVLRPRESGIVDLYKARLALIRPDQHVAWRGDKSADAAALIATVVGHNATAPQRAARLAVAKTGVHSIDHFAFSVPSLDDAERFYTQFGLDVRRNGNALELRTFGQTHRWGVIHATGAAKRIEYLSLGIFAEDVAAFEQRIAKAGIACEPHPLSDGQGLWLRNPDGIPLQLKVAPQVTPSVRPEPAAPARAARGEAAAPTRSQVTVVRPRRLSHVLCFSPDVPRMIAFCHEILGMDLSDKSLDVIAFMHGVHGSDHHLLAFAKSDKPGLHHTSWDVASIDDVGLGSEQMRSAGYTEGWGVGRHVLGSNHFYYVRDPWNSWCEYSAGIDYIPGDGNWQSGDFAPEDSFYVWGPSPHPEFITNFEPNRA